MKIVLFEDNAVTARDLSKAIRDEAPRGTKVEVFSASDAAKPKRIKLYEDRLASEIQSEPYSNATLWVTDRDLSSIKHYEGLSEATVSKVASGLGIPLCKYKRGPSADDVLQRERAWGDSQIVLDATKIPDLAAKIVVLAKGFAQIANDLDGILSGPGSALIRTPADVMAAVLGKPMLSDQIALYGSGDQSMIVEILPFVDSKKRMSELKERFPSLIGYWLFDSLLRFPGILVNSVAAASYLDIATTQFEGPKVRDIFVEALYRGPFHNECDPYWWRSELDEIVAKSGEKSGNELAAKRLKKSVRHCLDSQKKKRAGWYCMVKKVPVSEDNSVGNISWFPPGADLARIRKDVFDQIGPWLGLY